MSTLIVYFSLTGNTKMIADIIESKIGADTLRIMTEKDYPKGRIARLIAGGKSAFFEESPKILPIIVNLDDYDTIIIGTPIWAGTMAPAMRTFLTYYDIADKNLAIYVCCSGGSASGTFEDIRDLANSDALSMMKFVEPRESRNIGLEDKIDEFLSGLHIGSSAWGYMNG